MSFSITCAECRKPTGAVWMDGDPYLPYIVCESCAASTEAAQVLGADSPSS